MGTTKPFTIPKSLVMRTFKAVKANAGSAGIGRTQTQVCKAFERISATSRSAAQTNLFSFRTDNSSQEYSAGDPVDSL